MNVFSLFDGISCGQIALGRTNIKVDKYFASEINKNAIKVTQHNYPNTIQLGDVTKINIDELPKIDLILAGSPCQGFSFAGKQLNFEDPRSKLFFVFVDILNKLKIKNPNIKFLLENVKMKKDCQNVISKELGVEPIEINSALVSAQNRKRLYWTNISNVSQPHDKKILLKDILEKREDYEFVHDGFWQNGKKVGFYWQYDRSGKGYNSRTSRGYFVDDKMGCLSYSAPHCAKILINNRLRLTTQVEHERLQTVPDNYTSVLEINKAKAALGNGWTVDIIAHILSFINHE